MVWMHLVVEIQEKFEMRMEMGTRWEVVQCQGLCGKRMLHCTAKLAPFPRQTYHSRRRLARGEYIRHIILSNYPGTFPLIVPIQYHSALYAIMVRQNCFVYRFRDSLRY